MLFDSPHLMAKTIETHIPETTEKKALMRSVSTIYNNEDQQEEDSRNLSGMKGKRRVEVYDE